MIQKPNYFFILQAGLTLTAATLLATKLILSLVAAKSVVTVATVATLAMSTKLMIFGAFFLSFLVFPIVPVLLVGALIGGIYYLTTMNRQSPDYQEHHHQQSPYPFQLPSVPLPRPNPYGFYERPHGPHHAPSPYIPVPSIPLPQPNPLGFYGGPNGHHHEQHPRDGHHHGQGGFYHG